jgi:hypothetical protein
MVSAKTECATAASNRRRGSPATIGNAPPCRAAKPDGRVVRSVRVAALSGRGEGARGDRIVGDAGAQRLWLLRARFRQTVDRLDRAQDVDVGQRLGVGTAGRDMGAGKDRGDPVLHVGGAGRGRVRPLGRSAPGSRFCRRSRRRSRSTGCHVLSPIGNSDRYPGAAIDRRRRCCLLARRYACRSPYRG